MKEKKKEILLLTSVFLFWFSVYTYPSFLTTYVITEGKGVPDFLRDVRVRSADD